jgi:hypothetical protein
MLKWLQYETVLGPEDGEPARPINTTVAGTLGTAGNVTAGRMMDEEKAIGGNTGDQAGLMAVSGPGLGDLLTEPAPTGNPVRTVGVRRVQVPTDACRLSISTRTACSSRTR